MLRYLPLAISCLPYFPCLASNHPFLANRCLAKLPLLLSPSYSVASCRWSWSWFHVGTWIFLEYHNISYLINASIYLVKGGRLGLMPGVFFHCCRPSFRHTGVMFLDFCVPYAVGWFMGPPWQFALNKTPPARPNLGFNICHLSLFPLGSADSRVIFILNPPGPVLLRVLVRTRATCSATSGKLEVWF